MATTITPRTIDQQEQKNIFSIVGKAIDESYGDAVITAAVTVLAMVYMLNVVHPSLAFATGFYFVGMIVQLLIRFVRRFDTHYTVDELADRVIELEATIKADLDEIKRNV